MDRKRCYLAILSAIFFVVFQVGLEAADFIEIPTLGGSSSHGRGVSDSGITAGDALLPGEGSTPGHAIVYIKGMIIDLGTLPIEEPGELELLSAAYAVEDVNNVTVVVGWSNFSQLSHTPTKAFRYVFGSGAGMESLGTLGGCCSGAYAINKSGVIVGNSTRSDDAIQAFKYTQQQGITELFSPLNWYRTDAYDINESGLIVGTALLTSYPSELYHACVWDGMAYADLGTLGGISSEARGVNDFKLIVGHSKTSGGVWRAFSYDYNTSGPMENLGVPETATRSFAYAVNNAGLIVGDLWIASISKYHAGLYVNGQWIDLQETFFPNWQSSMARAINNDNLITGYGVNDLGEERGWILKLDAGLIADLDGNGIVDLLDLAIMASQWIQKEPWYPVDVP